MAMCSENCGAVATVGEKCAVHGAGYRRHDGSRTIVCPRCRKQIRKGEWTKEGRQHASCKPAAAVR